MQSALDQTHPHMEVIVIDDESPDDTPAVAAAFAGRIRYHRGVNAGVAAARNVGLAMATGRFVVFLDADDLLLPDMVRRHLSVAAETGADVTCGGWQGIDRDGCLRYLKPAPHFDAPDPFHTLLRQNLAPPVCYVFRRSAVDAVGRFDPDRGLNGHEDWDLLLRLAAAGHRFARVDGEPLSAYRQYAGSSSRQIERMYDTGHRALAKARQYHRRCPRCDGEFADVARVFRRDYYDMVAGPLVRGSAAKRTAPAVTWRLARRMARDPRLITYTLAHAGPTLARRAMAAVRRCLAGPPKPPV